MWDYWRHVLHVAFDLAFQSAGHTLGTIIWAFLLAGFSFAFHLIRRGWTVMRRGFRKTIIETSYPVLGASLLFFVWHVFPAAYQLQRESIERAKQEQAQKDGQDFLARDEAAKSGENFKRLRIKENLGQLLVEGKRLQEKASTDPVSAKMQSLYSAWCRKVESYLTENLNSSYVDRFRSVDYSFESLFARFNARLTVLSRFLEEIKD